MYVELISEMFYDQQHVGDKITINWCTSTLVILKYATTSNVLCDENMHYDIALLHTPYSCCGHVKQKVRLGRQVRATVRKTLHNITA